MGWMIKSENYTGIIKLSFVKKRRTRIRESASGFRYQVLPIEDRMPRKRCHFPRYAGGKSGFSPASGEKSHGYAAEVIVSYLEEQLICQK